LNLIQGILFPNAERYKKAHEGEKKEKGSGLFLTSASHSGFLQRPDGRIETRKEKGKRRKKKAQGRPLWTIPSTFNDLIFPHC